LRMRSEIANARNASLGKQCAVVEHLLLLSESVNLVLNAVRNSNLPDAYLGAGSIAATVWNAAHGFPSSNGISDFDIVYFDAEHLDEEAEAMAAAKLQNSLQVLNVKIDVKNQARVHLWYERRFGKVIPPYESTSHAISTWPSTSSCVGVRLNESNGLEICAPFGLHDLLSLVVRPNKVIVPESIYCAKSARWKQVWPLLTVLDW
jgi:uncharacterized protein